MVDELELEQNLLAEAEQPVPELDPIPLVEPPELESLLPRPDPVDAALNIGFAIDPSDVKLNNELAVDYDIPNPSLNGYKPGELVKRQYRIKRLKEGLEYTPATKQAIIDNPRYANEIEPIIDKVGVIERAWRAFSVGCR